jgi:hypothetical protein
MICLRRAVETIRLFVSGLRSSWSFKRICLASSLETDLGSTSSSPADCGTSHKSLSRPSAIWQKLQTRRTIFAVRSCKRNGPLVLCLTGGNA